jgi:hypothetical protein
MGRRSHHRGRHGHRLDVGRPARPASAAPTTAPPAEPFDQPRQAGPLVASHDQAIEPAPVEPNRSAVSDVAVVQSGPEHSPTTESALGPPVIAPAAVMDPPPTPNRVSPSPVGGQPDERLGACTAPQLRRFIKSRPYVPLHELRRRFAIDGDDDEVSPVDLDDRRIFVGLPGRESVLLGELLRAGDIGFELSVDPATPIVVGVFPMRPVGRG